MMKPVSDCIFCKICRNEIESELLFEDKHLVAFDDINPKAPVHFLVIPKKHIENLFFVYESDSIILAKIQIIIPQIAREKGLDDGFRVIQNNGAGGHQEVYHLHYHVIGGGRFKVF